jgi:hypothetical protein
MKQKDQMLKNEVMKENVRKRNRKTQIFKNSTKIYSSLTSSRTNQMFVCWDVVVGTFRWVEHRPRFVAPSRQAKHTWLQHFNHVAQLRGKPYRITSTFYCCNIHTLSHYHAITCFCLKKPFKVLEHFFSVNCLF